MVRVKVLGNLLTFDSASIIVFEVPCLQGLHAAISPLDFLLQGLPQGLHLAAGGNWTWPLGRCRCQSGLYSPPIPASDTASQSLCPSALMITCFPRFGFLILSLDLKSCVLHLYWFLAPFSFQHSQCHPFPDIWVCSLAFLTRKEPEWVSMVEVPKARGVFQEDQEGQG